MPELLDFQQVLKDVYDPVAHALRTKPSGAGMANDNASFVTMDSEPGLTNETVLGTGVIMRGTLAARPAASKAGRLYYVTDGGDNRVQRDTGAVWEDLGIDWSYVSGVAIVNGDVDAAAGISESKLNLLFPTHDPANDPSAGEKAALIGTSGAPGAGNKYVTDADPRNTNARTPSSTLAHASSHDSLGSDPLTSIEESQLNLNFPTHSNALDHARIHELATPAGLGADHTVSGLSAGQVLRASAAAAAAFAQLQHADLGGVSPDQHHLQSHVLATGTALGTDHTISGAAAGEVLRALGATTAAFDQLQYSDLGGVPSTFAPSAHKTSHEPAGADALTLLDNSSIKAAAGIVESKLTLNFATHSNANDPSAGEKAALPGTNGTPGAGNKYVTDSDPRNANARTPTAHASSHVDAGSDEITTGLDVRAYPLKAGTLASRPAAGIAGQFFWTTDEHILYRDDGAAWVKVAVADYPDLDSRAHVLAGTGGLGADHTVSGLAAGQYLRATGAATAAFQTLQSGDLSPLVLLLAGQAFGGLKTVGSTDNNNLTIRTNNVVRQEIWNDGELWHNTKAGSSLGQISTPVHGWGKGTQGSTSIFCRGLCDILTFQTTDATTQNKDIISLDKDSMANVTVFVSGMKSDGTAACSFIRRGTFRKDGSNNAVQVGSTVLEYSEIAEIVGVVGLTVSGNNIRCQVTGVAATTINWTISGIFVATN